MLPRPRLLLLVPLALFLGLASGNELARAQGGSSPSLKINPDGKLVSLVRATPAVPYGEPIRLTALRAAAGTCAKVKIVVGDREETRSNVTFPLALEIPLSSDLHPKKAGPVEITVKGASADCWGAASTTVTVSEKPVGAFLRLGVLNTKYSTIEYYAGRPLDLSLTGTGTCHLKLVFETRKGSKMYEREIVEKLPATYRTDFNLPPYGVANGDGMNRREYRVRVDVVKGPSALASCIGGEVAIDLLTSCSTAVGGSPGRCEPYAEKKTTPASQTKADSPQASDPPSSPSGGGGGGPKPPLPAKGTLTSISVPGGSFAVDDVQKLSVGGSGACGFDLTISNKSYGGSYEQTFDVLPVPLAPATLFEGSHFGKLGEGSYWARATGKNGCTGTAQIDFKVTGPTTTKSVPGKPVVSFDKKPMQGDAYSASKDSNIWFKVELPSSVKSEPYVTCCQVQFDFKNAYGGWEPAPNMPYDDAGFGLAASSPNAVVPKSVSGFKQGTEWRVRMRAIKYKTDFAWSDWVTFKTAP